MKALMDEISDWGVRDYPLAGGDVLSMLVKHGFATKDEAITAYEAARKRHPDYHEGETIYGMTDVTAPKDMIDF